MCGDIYVAWHVCYYDVIALLPSLGIRYHEPVRHIWPLVLSLSYFWTSYGYYLYLYGRVCSVVLLIWQ